MSEKAIWQASAAFMLRFGREPDGISFAPGRVNLIGDHVDYNDGLVLPMPIAQGTAIAWAKASGAQTTILAADLEQEATFDGAASETAESTGWRTYCTGMLQLATSYSVTPPPMDMAISGDLPRGSGLSSSASLCIALGRAIAANAGMEAEAVSLAETAQRVEHEFAGVNCGIMDQMAIAAGQPGHALLLDCRDLSYRNIAVPDAWQVAIIESGVTRALVDGEYNLRRAQCDSALAKTGMSTWRDVTQGMISTEILDGIEMKRTRHIVGEIARVEGAAMAMEQGNLQRFGQLITASHASLRDDFETSHPEVDALVARTQDILGRQGSARITGAGFGGAVVVVTSSDRVASLDQLEREIISV